MAKSLDYWRGYFSGANASICDIIDNAITVAGLDYPEELKLRRGHIAELLFTCKLTKCSGCDSVKGFDGEKVIEVEKFMNSSGEFEEEWKRRCEEIKVNCCGDDHTANVSHGEVEALKIVETEESQMIREVVRVEEILDNHAEQSDFMLFDLLRRLQLTDISIEILETTKLGKSVSGLKKHGSKKIRNLARTLIQGWIARMDSWMNATSTTDITEDTSSPESIKASTTDFEQGLPSPPLDEGAFTAHSIDLSKLFDGMDDDGNEKKPPLRNESVLKQKQQQLNDNVFVSFENKVEDTMEEEIIMKKKFAAVIMQKNRPSNGIKTRAELKFNTELKSQLKRVERAVQKKTLADQDHVISPPKHRDQQSSNAALRKMMLPQQQENGKPSDEASIQVKLEATKRKLHERYREAKNAKKQRTIQVLELQDTPKPRARHLMKPGHDNHNRHWARNWI